MREILKIKSWREQYIFIFILFIVDLAKHAIIMRCSMKTASGEDAVPSETADPVLPEVPVFYIFVYRAVIEFASPAWNVTNT